jgi:nicotinate-nucleotide pyrophosphorylase (carboxylating)
VTLSAAEIAACRTLVELALREDLGPDRATGDATSLAVIPATLPGSAVFVSRVAGILCGLPIAQEVCAAVDRGLAFRPLLNDGARVNAGDRLATIAGPMRGILAAERTALNFLQRLSGIATETRRYVDAVAGLPCRILDTRKTLPGWRLLDKYAVRAGGGHNHRMGLHDGILIKDNHLAAIGGRPDAVTRAVEEARTRFGHQLPLEIEVDTLDQLDRALACGPDMILLDNMTPDQLREAVRRRNQAAPAVLLESSGGVTLASVRARAETGVDRISIGALTHSVQALDIALDYE